MDLKYYVGIFLRRWWMLVLSTILVGGVTAMRTSNLPTTYTAKVRLLYESNNVATSVLNNAGMMYPMSWNNPVDTQLQLITTRPNVEEVIKRLGLGEGPTAVSPDAILAGLGAEVDRNTDIIVLRYSSTDPERTVKIVNEVGRVFVERNKSYHKDAARQTRTFIEEQLAKTERLLNEAEDELRRFRESNKVFQVSDIGGATASRLANIDSTVIDMDIEKRVLQAKQAEARRHLELTDLNLAQRLEKLRADPLFNALQGEITKEEADLTVKKAQYTDDAPEVREIEGRMSKVKAALTARVRLLVGDGLGDKDLMAARTATEQKHLDTLVTAEAELAAMNARVKALDTTRGIYESKFSELPAKDQQLTQLMRRQTAAAETYNVFLRRMQEVRITEAINVGNVRIVEESSVAAAVLAPKAKLIGLACLLGFVFGLGLALLIEFLDDRIRRPEEAENVLELPILGLLPWIDGREHAAKRLVVLEDPRSPVTESYRALQTYTRMMDPDSEQKCIMITSPGPKEGKSTVLANLAITSAQLGKRTLIIDTDLRAPSQHINFDRPNLMGIYDVVYEGLPAEEAIQPTDVDNLDILCTGPVPPDPVQTLHSEAFKKLFERLRKDYDAIFFDAPPINLFTDAAVLGRMVDSVLLVVDVRSTTRNGTLTAKDLLIKARVPLRGMVVKNMSYKMSRYHNRYFERYYMDRLKHLADE